MLSMTFKKKKKKQEFTAFLVRFDWAKVTKDYIILQTGSYTVQVIPPI